MRKKKSSYKVEVKDGIHVVQMVDYALFDGDPIDEASEGIFKADGFDSKVVVNFEKVDFLSSAVLGALVSLHKKLKDGNGFLRIVGLKAPVFEVFERTRLNTLFQFYKTEEEALKG